MYLGTTVTNGSDDSSQENNATTQFLLILSTNLKIKICKTIASPVTLFWCATCSHSKRAWTKHISEHSPEKYVLTFGMSSVDSFFQRETVQHNFYLLMNYFIQ